jgi:hypothetical protein
VNPKEALAVLTAAFRTENIAPPTERLYQQRLQDIPPPLLQATVHRIIDGPRRDKRRGFPDIQELRETAAEIAGILPPSPEEALAIIRKADVEEAVYRRDGSFAYTERFWRWPAELSEDTVQLCENALSVVGDPVNGHEKRIFGWEQQFKATYEPVMERHKQKALTNLSRAALPLPRKALEP